MKRINKNLILNGLRTLINLAFPMITFPYLSRRLMPEGLGLIEFSNSIISYFILICSLGIPLYGIREIAFIRDNKRKMSKLFLELFLINLFMVILTYICFFYYINTLKNMNINKELLKILSINIFFTVMGVEWFYQGIEEYSYITKRSLFFKILSLVFILIFIKNQYDVSKYAFILVLSLSGSNFLNLLKVQSFIDLKNLKLKELKFKKHLKPIFKIFLMAIAGSIYLNLDSVMLGYMHGSYEVGMYTAASKMNRVVVGVILSVIACLTPSISNLLQNNKKQEYLELVNYIISLLGILIFPLLIGFYFCSKEILILFSGEYYLSALKALKIMIPIIFLIPLNNFIALQILYPNKKEELVLKSIVGGAILNFTINYLLIPKYSYIGAAIGTIIAESTILILLIIFGKKYLLFNWSSMNVKKQFLSAFLMGIFLFFLRGNDSLIFKIFMGGFIYLISLIILKEKIVNSIIKNINKKIKG